MGVIIRTAGANRTKQEIKRDFEYLLRQWDAVRDLTLRSTAPMPVYEEGNLIKRTIRDLYSKDVDDILVEGEQGFDEAHGFMTMLMPSHADAVKHYRDPVPLFQRYGVEDRARQHVQSDRAFAIGRLHRHQSDRSAGRRRRELRQVDARASHRGHGAQDELGSVRGNRAPIALARFGGPRRHRLHRHGGAPQQPLGREAAEGLFAARPRAHSTRPDQSVRAFGNVAPAPARGHGRRRDDILPALRRARRHSLGRIDGAARVARRRGILPARKIAGDYA